MKIALGCDHGGYDLKQHIIKVLERLGHEAEDFGCFSKESCDYPDFGAAAAKAVAAGKCDRGIVICTTGIGISIAANKVKGVRCAHCADCLQAEMTRRHNDANMMAIPMTPSKGTSSSFRQPISSSGIPVPALRPSIPRPHTQS